MPIWSGGGGDGLPSQWTVGAFGQLTIAPDSPNVAPLTLIGAAGSAAAQTNLIQCESDDTNVVFYFDAGGSLYSAGGSGAAAWLLNVGEDTAGNIDINPASGKLLSLNDGLGNVRAQIQDNILALVGPVIYGGIHTNVILSGALPTVAPVSATAFQVNATYDTILVVPVTYNPGVATTATCKIELSPDNVTFSTLVTKTVPVGTVFDGQIDPLTLRVPGGWYVKLTVTNATLGTGTYYY